MNARKYKTVLQIALVIALAQTASADSTREAISQGNKLYLQGNFNQAINHYDQALVEAPQALEPKFNKANSYYRLDDLGKAMDLYRQVAAESKDMTLVAKAKYNLGNTFFQQGSKQKDSNLKKAIEDMETAIGSWRGVLDSEPENTKAAKNIEVARLTIKDLLDQLNKQQDPNQPQDPNQQSQQNQPQQGSQQDSGQSQDQKQEQKQAPQEDSNQPQDPNQADQPQQKESNEEKERRMAPDATAREILDREQQQKKERQMFERARWQKVEKDW